MPSQRYPSTLSQGQGGPSRRPTRTQYSAPSIDDEFPPPPLQLFTPPPPHLPHHQPQQPQLKKSTSRPLNPNSKPYTPKNFRSVQNLRSARAAEPHYPSIPPPEAFHSLYPSTGPPAAAAAADAGYEYDSVFTARPQYSSLQHLLEQAGYADTRVETPPAERVGVGRRIKKTFDEVDAEEVRDLYSTFGMAGRDRYHGGVGVGAPGGVEVTHITEPGMPLKSSSSLLRNLALQDSSLHHLNQNPGQSPMLGHGQGDAQFGSSYDTWWGGGFAALGRAAKAVMEMSPPSKGNEGFEEVARQMTSSSGIGLGLAKGGEGVRKVKSNWELGGSARDPEEIPPLPTLRERRSAVVDTVLPPLDLPPVAVRPRDEEDEFGFSPLPADYEAQCDDDEFFTTSFDADVGSLRSTPTERSRESTVERQMPPGSADEVSLDSPESVKSLGFGLGGYDLSRRIMADAVDYDDCDQDSPTKKTFVKPLPAVVDEICPIAGDKAYSAEHGAAPECEITADEATAPSVPSPAPVPAPLKYGDRATKLRMARSTPVLARPRPDPSWFGSIKSYIVPSSTTDSAYASIPAVPSPSTSAPAPLKLTPALPAVPALAKPVAVVCDSSSDMAEDLPPLPPMITVVSPPAGVIASVALRTRKSLASLRSAWTGASATAPPLPSPTGTDGSTLTPTPVLSPRLDLAESEYFAGWSPRRDTSSKPAWSTPKKVESHQDGYGPTEIDYTRSFFYKPCTPPVAPGSSSTTYEAMISTAADPTPSSSSSSSNPVARRQRSIKSLRAALLLPVAPAPSVPSIPNLYRSALTYATARSASGQSDSTVASTTLATPPQYADSRLPDPPAIAILSPGAWEAGLPARELVLEGEEWDARDGQQVGSWSRGRDREAGLGGKGKKGKGGLKRKSSKKAVRAD